MNQFKGLFFFFFFFLKKKKMCIFMVGLGTAGRIILYKLNLGEIVTTIPTTVFNTETVECHGVGHGQPKRDHASVALLLPEHTVSSLWLSAVSENT